MAILQAVSLTYFTHSFSLPFSRSADVVSHDRIPIHAIKTNERWVAQLKWDTESTRKSHRKDEEGGMARKGRGAGGRRGATSMREIVR